VSKVEPSNILEATGCVMDYRKSLDLDQPTKLEQASMLLLLSAKSRWVGHKIKVGQAQNQGAVDVSISGSHLRGDFY
jgi:hypothetical protein